MNLQWLVEFIAQDENHFFGALAIISTVFGGLTMVARAIRGGHCEVCHKRFVDELEEEE